MKLRLRLRRIPIEHRCMKPRFAVNEDDVFRCEICGQRWRAWMTQNGHAIWQHVTWLEYWTGQ